jgi:hypothetical protein
MPLKKTSIRPEKSSFALIEAESMQCRRCIGALQPLNTVSR